MHVFEKLFYLIYIIKSTSSNSKKMEDKKKAEELLNRVVADKVLSNSKKNLDDRWEKLKFVSEGDMDQLKRKFVIDLITNSISRSQ